MAGRFTTHQSWQVSIDCQICGQLICRLRPDLGHIPGTGADKNSNLRALTWSEHNTMQDGLQETRLDYVDRIDLTADSSLVIKNTPSAGQCMPHLGYAHGKHPWTFVFHSACWDLLVTRFGTSDVDCKELRARLGRILYTLNWRGRTRHACLPSATYRTDRFGQFLLPTQPHDMAQVLSSTGIDLDTQSRKVDKLITQSMRKHGLSMKNRRSLLRMIHPSADMFARLPFEMVQHVLSFLSIRDLAQLRLASRVAASVSVLDLLPRQFWEYRFFHEFGYVIPKVTSGDEDWRTLYFAMNRGQDLTKVFESDRRLREQLRITNRERIWKAMDNLDGVLNNPISGLPLVAWDWRDWNIDSVQHSPKDGFNPPHVVCTCLAIHLPPGDGPLAGGPVHQIKRLPQITKAQALWGIGVTLVQLGDAAFVSGIRLLYDKGSSQMGYVYPPSETILEVSPSELISGLKVTHNRGGIQGVRFVLKNQSVSTLWNRETAWVRGRTGPASHQKVKYTRINRTMPWQPLTLVGCFDMCKMIGIAVVNNGGSTAQGV